MSKTLCFAWALCPLRKSRLYYTCTLTFSDSTSVCGSRADREAPAAEKTMADRSTSPRGYQGDRRVEQEECSG